MDNLNTNNDKFQVFKNCIIGNTTDGGRIFSFKLMVEQIMNDSDFDVYESEEFILRNFAVYRNPNDLVLYDLH